VWVKVPWTAIIIIVMTISISINIGQCHILAVIIKQLLTVTYDAVA